MTLTTEETRAWELAEKDAQYVATTLRVALESKSHPLTFDDINDAAQALARAAKRVEGLER